VISLVQRGRYCSDDGATDRGSTPRHPDRGATPRRVHVGGASPRRKIPFTIDVEGGEISTLMWIDGY
jgi:hypothetical protein